jgi:hypothetical protein
MKIAGYVVFLLAFGSYARLILMIRRLVAESRQIGTDARFRGFLLTFVLLAAGMACLARGIMGTGGIR